MTHTHFTIMGGLAIKHSNRNRQRLSATHFINLLEQRRIRLPDELEEEIFDKSKSSPIAKLVACIKITWVFTQIIGRAIEKLSTSLLEIFTMCIVICSLLSYGFWFQKLLDIRIPIILESDCEDLECAINPLGNGINTVDKELLVTAVNPRHIFERRHNLVPLYLHPYGKNISMFTMSVVLVFATCHLIA
jgi:hypothetical protein